MTGDFIPPGAVTWCSRCGAKARAGNEAWQCVSCRRTSGRPEMDDGARAAAEAMAHEQVTTVARIFAEALEKSGIRPLWWMKEDK